jgi:hypothetical protein
MREAICSLFVALGIAACLVVVMAIGVLGALTLLMRKLFQKPVK